MSVDASYFETAAKIFNLHPKELRSTWSKGSDSTIDAFETLDTNQSYYLHKGIVREYFVDKKGTEHTTKFIQGPTIYGPFLYKLYRKDKTELISQSLTPLICRKLDSDFTISLIKKNPLYRRVTINSIISSLKVKVQKDIRLHESSALERYHLFTQEFPIAVNLIPLKYIASYLNMTPETLSRIRNNYRYKK